MSFKTVIIFLFLFIAISPKTYCQTSPLCPKYDTTRKSWAFVDCKTQKQVLAAEYRPTASYIVKGYPIEEDYEEVEIQPYFWSKLNSDSLKIVDSIGNLFMAISKQNLPTTISHIKIISQELITIYWTDTIIKQQFTQERSMLVTTQGRMWTPKNMLNTIVSYADTVGENYIANIEHIETDTLISYGYVLVDKQCNPLSKVYTYMYNDVWDKVELIEVADKKTGEKGYLDFNGKVIIHGLYGNIYNYFVDDYIVLAKNKKQGVLDGKGKTILPFKYHEIRQLKNGFFVVKDTNGISNEYVVDKKGKRLTKPIFGQIDSFANGKVWQKWSNKTLLYSSEGQCLSSAKDIEEAGFMVFLQDTKTKIFYSQYSNIPDTVRDFEVILQSPNQFQYSIIKGEITFRGGRSYREIIDNKVHFYESDFIDIREVLSIEKISIKNNKTGEEKIVDKRFYYNALWKFYRE